MDGIFYIMRKLNWAVFLSLSLLPLHALAADGRPCSDLPGLKQIRSTDSTPPIEVFYSQGQEATAKQVLAMAEMSDKKLKAFFETKRKLPYQIFLAKDNAQFEELTGEKNDWKESWWVIGHDSSENDHILRDPSLWDPRSREDNKLPDLIAHEMTHSYTVALTGKSEDKRCQLTTQKEHKLTHHWFFEGLAVALSGQLETWKRLGLKFNFDNYPHFEQIMRPKGSYATAGTAVDYLLKAFGRKKILEAIQKMPADASANLEETDRAIFDTLGLKGEAKTKHEQQWKETTIKEYVYSPSS